MHRRRSRAGQKRRRVRPPEETLAATSALSLLFSLLLFTALPVVLVVDGLVVVDCRSRSSFRGTPSSSAKPPGFYRFRRRRYDGGGGGGGKEHLRIPGSRRCAIESVGLDGGSGGSDPDANRKYSRRFTRYRIPVTAVPSSLSASEQQQQQKNPILAFLGEVKASSTRRGLERRYGDSLRWFEGQDGVRALATLWREAADVATSSSAPSATSPVVLAFPDAHPRVVLQFSDLLRWLLHNNATDDASASADIEAEYWYESDKVPCLKLTRQSRGFNATSRIRTSSPRLSQDDVDEHQQSWVKRVLVDMRICPFTRSVKRSGQGLADVGVPVGLIAYHTSFAETVIGLMADTWKVIADMVDAGPKQVSSILLAAPGFDDKFDLWAGPVFALLEAGVVAAGAEDAIGVVCFHPEYQTPDGSTFPGFGHMHSVPRLENWVKETASSGDGTSNDEVWSPQVVELTTEQIAAGGAWQRRSPHATINVLRADQLQAAEGRRNTPQLYTRNIAKLVIDVGLEKLQDDLDRERGVSSSRRQQS